MHIATPLPYSRRASAASYNSTHPSTTRRGHPQKYDDKTLFRRIFPAEIILHILTFLETHKSSLISAALASHAFQLECERLLYKHVHLGNWRNLASFLWALEKQCRRQDRVRSLVVAANPYSGFLPALHADGLIKSLGHALPLMSNLQELTLKSDLNFIELKGMRLPQRLQSLCIYAELQNSYMVKLLGAQESLRHLDYVWGEVDMPVPSNFLPNLEGITSNVRSIVKFVPNRPINRVEILGTIEQEEQEPLFCALNQSTSSIRHFTGQLTTNSLSKDLSSIFHDLPDLEVLTIGICADYPVPKDEDKRAEVAWSEINISGRRLESFALYSDTLELNPLRSVDDLQYITGWHKQCPSLTSLTVNGTTWGLGRLGWKVGEIADPPTRYSHWMLIG